MISRLNFILGISICASSSIGMEAPTEPCKIVYPEKVELTSAASKEVSKICMDESDEKFLDFLFDQLRKDRELYESASINTTEGHAMLEAVLDQCADLEVQDVFGYTPVLKACQVGNLQALRILKEHDADMRVTDKFFFSALHNCVPDHADQRSPNRMAIIEFLVKNGVSKYLPDYYTPLKHAVVRGDLEAVKALILSLPPLFKTNEFGKLLCSPIEERVEKEAQNLKRLFSILPIEQSLFFAAQKMKRIDIMQWVNPDQPIDEIKKKLHNASIKPIRRTKSAKREALSDIDSQRYDEFTKRAKTMLKHVP